MPADMLPLLDIFDDIAHHREILGLVLLDVVRHLNLDWTQELTTFLSGFALQMRQQYTMLQEARF